MSEWSVAVRTYICSRELSIYKRCRHEKSRLDEARDWLKTCSLGHLTDEFFVELT